MIPVTGFYLPQAVLIHLVSKKLLYLSFLRNREVAYTLLVDSTVNITAEPAVQKDFQQAHLPTVLLN